MLQMVLFIALYMMDILCCLFTCKSFIKLYYGLIYQIKPYQVLNLASEKSRAFGRKLEGSQFFFIIILINNREK